MLLQLFQDAMNIRIHKTLHSTLCDSISFQRTVEYWLLMSPTELTLQMIIVHSDNNVGTYSQTCFKTTFWAQWILKEISFENSKLNFYVTRGYFLYYRWESKINQYRYMGTDRSERWSRRSSRTAWAASPDWSQAQLELAAASSPRCEASWSYHLLSNRKHTVINIF